MACRERARGATPCPRSGVAAKRSYPASEVRAAAESARLQKRRSSLEDLPLPKARGGGLEEGPNIQGAVAVPAPEGLEELFHVQGQEAPW